MKKGTNRAPEIREGKKEKDKWGVLNAPYINFPYMCSIYFLIFKFGGINSN